MQETIQGVLWEIVVPAVIPVASGFLLVFLNKVSGAAIAWFEARTGVEISDGMEQKIDGIIARSVRSVEEMARAKAKSQGGKMEGSEKLDAAMNKVKKALASAGIKIDEEDVKDRIHDVVNFERNGDGGSLGE